MIYILSVTCTTTSYTNPLQLFSQNFSGFFVGSEWTLEFGAIPTESKAATTRQSVLRVLELLRRKVTGGRPLSRPERSADTVSLLEESELVEAFGIEVYLDHYEGAWVVALELFF
jgi:hypothetical protein